jgi:uncharacterized membrane protein YtjA (UPF0391 family)
MSFVRELGPRRRNPPPIGCVDRHGTSPNETHEEDLMANFGLLHYAVVFLVVAVIAAAVGFGGVAGVAMEGARLLFWIFIVLFALSLVAGLIRR